MPVDPWRLAVLAIPTLVLLHLYVAPFTKVEESFNIQATHDILTHGVPLPWESDNPRAKFAQLYDHVKFPGAVPRTFIGSLLLSAAAAPVVAWTGLSLPKQQALVRAILGLVNAAALLYYARRVRRAFGRSTAAWFLLFLASQFHVFYYASRTLPNMFAFAPSTVALGLLLPSPGSSAIATARRTRLALYVLTITAVIFRSELVLLIFSEVLTILVAAAPEHWPRLVTRIFMPAAASGLVAGLLLTVVVDTYFWRPAPFPHFLTRPLWPELEAFVSNVFPKAGSMGASAWGTSPWHWYFTSALPRLFLNPALVPLCLYSFATAARRTDAARILLATLTYTALYSVLAHKETRFLFPLIPPLTLLAALGAAQLAIASARSTVARAAKVGLVASSLLTALVAHGVLLPLSAFTYPGGQALRSVHAASTRYAEQRQINVHLTNLALQTGVTHFLEMPEPAAPLVILPGSADGRYPSIRTGATRWQYDKSDNSSAAPVYDRVAFWDRFDYVVVQDPDHALPPGAWHVVDRIAGLSGRPPRLLGPGVGRGTLVLDGDRVSRREKDGLARLLEQVYEPLGLAAWATWAYGVVHDVLREGIPAGPSLTRGYWIHWAPEWTLYVMKRGA